MNRPALPALSSATKEWQALTDVCEEYLDYVEEKNEDRSSKISHYVFERAMELVYGPNVWDWVNEQII